MTLLFADKVTENKEEFLAKVQDISKKLGIDPNWLMVVMNNESGLNSHIVNSIGATGLIQFVPATAIALGTTTDALKKMTNVQQLDYVYAYLKSFKYRIYSYIDLYFAIFFPKAIGKPLDWIFQASNLGASIIAKQNPAFDLNKDGVLTVREVQEAMLQKVPAAFREIFKKKT